MSTYLTFALFSPILPDGGRVAGSGKQITLGQYQEHGQAGHGGALSPVVFEQAEKAPELGEGVIDLASSCRDVDSQDKCIRLENGVGEAGRVTVLGQRLLPPYQILGHPAVTIDQDYFNP